MKTILTAVIVVLTVAGVFVYRQGHAQPRINSVSSKSTSSPASKTAVAKAQAAQSAQEPGHCAGNGLAQLVVVDISDRHMWGCEAGKQVYDSSVITGMEFLPADLTPTGTYKIYGKQTNLHLRGSDSTGSWDDFVYYWLPFLSNKYGVYGFHDATWRKDTDFGKVSPNSSDASHGCVELPLAAAKWLYNWSHVGTTLTIRS